MVVTKDRYGILISILFLFVSILLFVVGYSTPVWANLTTVYEDTTTDILATTTVGLWRTCMGSACRDLGSIGSAWHMGVQTLESVAFIMMLAAGGFSVLCVVCAGTDYSKYIGTFYLALVATACVVGIVGVCVYRYELYREAERYSIGYLYWVNLPVVTQDKSTGYSFILTIFGLLGLIGVFIAASFDIRRTTF